MCTNGFYLCSPLNIRGKKKTNKLCICISSKLSFRLAGTGLSTRPTLSWIHPDAETTWRWWHANESRYYNGNSVCDSPGRKTQACTQVLRQTRSARPLFFWPALSAPELIKSDMMHGGNEPMWRCEQLSPQTPLNIYRLPCLPASVHSFINIQNRLEACL